MMEAVRKNKLVAIPQFQSASLRKIIDWYLRKGYKKVVVKPLESAGGDNVHFCTSIQEIKQACQKILHQKNVFGELNKRILIQQFIRGDEYAVNTVSLHGKHYVSDVWKVNKLAHTPAYDYCEIVPSTHPRYQRLIKYTEQVLSSLGIRHGAAHTELRYNENGPILIETAARLMGAAQHSFEAEIYQGNTQVSLLVTSLLDPKGFQDILKRKLAQKKFGMNIHLVSRVHGKVSDFDMASFLKSLPSTHSFILPPSGYPVAPSENLIGFIGIVFLINDDPAQLHRDKAAIRAAERNYFYTNLKK
ncbi:MAG: ATP-grasp domain-containing protein [Bacteroidota bacterium]